MNLGEKIDNLFQLREQIRELDKELQALKADKNELELEILGDLDSQGLQLTRGGRATVSISEQVVPVVEDWDAYYEYIQNEGALFLLERRPATAAWRELYESGELPPGTTPFTKRSLSLRKLK